MDYFQSYLIHIHLKLKTFFILKSLDLKLITFLDFTLDFQLILLFKFLPFSFAFSIESKICNVLESIIFEKISKVNLKFKNSGMSH